MRVSEAIFSSAMYPFPSRWRVCSPGSCLAVVGTTCAANPWTRICPGPADEHLDPVRDMRSGLRRVGARDGSRLLLGSV